MDLEIWKKIIINSESTNYSVSSYGKVRNDITNKILKSKMKKHGYMEIGIYEKGKQVFKTIHRLVAENFLPNPENKKCVDHIDNNRINNKINNLRWATHVENIGHMLDQKRGRISHQNGSENDSSLFTEQEILEIRELYKEGVSQREIARISGCNYATIHYIVKRKTWKHI